MSSQPMSLLVAAPTLARAASMETMMIAQQQQLSQDVPVNHYTSITISPVVFILSLVVMLLVGFALGEFRATRRTRSHPYTPIR